MENNKIPSQLSKFNSIIKSLSLNFILISSIIFLILIFYFIKLTVSDWTPPESDLPPQIVALNLLAGYLVAIGIIGICMLKIIQHKLSISKDKYYILSLHLIYFQIGAALVLPLVIAVFYIPLQKIISNIQVLYIVPILSISLSIIALTLIFKSIIGVYNSVNLRN